MVETASKWRINTLCILGLSVGLIALFLPWNWDFFGHILSAHYVLPGSGADTGLYDAFNVFSYLSISQSPIFVCMLLLYVLGMVVALVSPIGGFIQIASAALAQIVGEMPIFGGTGGMLLPHGTSYYWNNWFPFGELLGVYSGIIVVVSMLKPIGPGYANRAIGIKERLFTFGRYHEQSSASMEVGREHEGFLGSTPSRLRSTGIMIGTFLIVIAPVVLIIVAFLIYLHATPGAGQFQRVDPLWA